MASDRSIAKKEIDGVETVLSFSGVCVKLNVDSYIGDEGSPVKRDKKRVGFVTASECGSRTMSVGGVTLLNGDDGFTVARMTIDLANKRTVTLR